MISLFSNPKPLTHFLLPLSSPSSRLLFVSLFSASPSLPSRRDEESRNARVSVWWDIENCGVPVGINVFKIAQSIMKAVRVNGIKGPVQISAFGDVLRLPKPIQEGLSVTGVNLVHVPNGGKNSADRLILVDLMSWVSQNPPPAHIFLISGDRDFAGVLHRLRMNNYNILLAGTPCISSAVLCSASSIMWDWGELVRRENFSGMHFNQPPDGSWYGYYRGPLEDPFKVIFQQNNSLKASDSSDEEVSSEKDPQVPKAVIKKICQIVNSYPYGVSSTELRAELTRSEVNIDRDYYGYGKFSRLLISIPHIIKVVPAGDGLLFVRPVSSQVRKPVESDEISERPITKYGTQDVLMGAKASDKKVVEEKVGEAAENKKELHETYERFDSLSKDEVDSKKELQASDKNALATTRAVEIEPILTVSSYNGAKEKVVEEVGEAAENKKELHGTSEKFDSLSKDKVDSKKELQGKETLDASETLSEEQYPKSEMGVFRKFWKKWFSSRKDGSSSKENLTKSSNQDEISPPSVSSSTGGLSMDAKNSGSCKSEDSEGFVAKVMSWFRPLENESSNNTLTGQSIQEPNMIEDSSKYEGGENTGNQVFSDDSFWRDIESFLKTYNASRIVFKATSREQFVRSLQNEGPLILQSLQENDLLHLVDLLVSDKKWIREFPSRIPRFRVILPPEKSPATSLPHNINGLSSIFLSSSHSKPHSIVHNTPSNKSRLEILGDCRKLVDELLEQNPDGFNMSCFREQFIEKYGYPLDHQKLGYLKLSSLLEIMPRVKIQYQMVFPEAKSSGSNSGMSDLPQKHEDDESPWDELGPVSKNLKSDQEKLRNVYEPCKSEDDEFSDVEEEGSEQKKSGVNEHKSSLLQILDGWYSSNNERSSSDQYQGLGSLEECPNDKHEVFSSTVNRGRKGRPQKSYVFVSDLGGRQRQAN